MDVKLEWKLSSDVDELLAITLKCKQELTNACMHKNGKARVVYCYVYASEKLCEFYSLSELSTDASEKPDNRLWPDASSVRCSTFPQFELYTSDVASNEQVMIVMRFDAGGDHDEEWFGLVTVT